MSKRIIKQIDIYSIDEACERLAKLKGLKKDKYSRGGFYKIVNRYVPELLEPVITEGDLKYLAEKIEKPGKRKKVDKNQQ